jgi:hypothetical protein
MATENTAAKKFNLYGLIILIKAMPNLLRLANLESTSYKLRRNKFQFQMMIFTMRHLHHRKRNEDEKSHIFLQNRDRKRIRLLRRDEDYFRRATGLE